MNLAIIKTGGKQYLVKEGDKLKIEKVDGNEGDAIKFETLLITDDKGSQIDLGQPTVKSKIEAKILKQAKDDKIMVAKYKAKTRYFRRVGHRQHYTQVLIGKI